MGRYLSLLLFIGLAFWSCEEEVEEDTTPPTVTITSHESGQSVSEIITIIATSEDDDGVSKVEFYLNTALVKTDTIVPYEYTLNATQYDNGHTLSIKVISYDNSDNTAETQVELNVDNSTAVPQGGNITSVTYDLESMTVMWEASKDGDFRDYKLLYSTTEDGGKDTIATYTDKTTTTYIVTDFDPTHENWFWVQVTDTLGLKSIESGMTNSLDSEPNPVNVTSVTYDLESMIITWEMSNDNDFVSYELLQSDTDDGTYTSVVTVTDQSITLHSLTEFDPTQRNWFKVKVTDHWGLTSIGDGMPNGIEPFPNPVDVISVTYDLESMTITWEDYVPNLSRINQMNQNTRSTVTNDFVSYELLQSDSEDGTYSSVVVITDQSTTSHSLTEYDPTMENWFKVKVTDFWGLNSTGSGMTNDIDSSPTEIDITSVTYDLSEMVVTWEQSNDNDFVSYELLQSDSEDGTYTSVIVITDQSTTSHSLTEYDPMMENWFKVKVTDFWGLNTTGTGMTNEIESTPPFPSVLYPILYYDGFQINWSQNNDYDFGSYKLYESLLEDMSNQTLVYETTEREDTNYVITGISEDRYYQITSEDVWGLQSTSGIEVLLIQIELWGEYYSVLNTTYLYLSINDLTGSIPSEIGNLTNLTSLWLNSNDLTGSIPSEIGNLTNLTELRLEENQLTGEIPESICDLNINWISDTFFNITENQLCPPYPSCVEDYVGYQDTSDCP